MTRYISTYKISIILLICQSLKLTVIWEDNTTNYGDLLSDNEANISLGVSNQSKEGIKPEDNNNKDIKPTDID